MLTPRQNVNEVMKGKAGKPDRFVKQYEFIKIIQGTPFQKTNPNPAPGQHNVVNAWGITKSWPEGTPGAFPVHTADKIVIKDMENWRDYVKFPNVKFDADAWGPIIEATNAVNREEYYVSPFVVPGLFEQCHYLMEIQNCLINFYEYPDEMADLIKELADWETAYAEEICKYMKPDALFHHDDWGSQISTFLKPEMFEEFYLDAYKQVYGYYKSHGVELIVHHSDSYARTLIPYMIDMGIDIWQGVMKSNGIKACIEEYQGQLTFMGGIDSGEVDFPGWTPEVVAKRVREACEEFGTSGLNSFIPNASQGLPMSTFPGVYEAIDAEIEKMSAEIFK